MSTPERIINNLHSVRSRIEQACKRAERNPSEVQLLAVTKNHTHEEIAPLIDAGQLILGENRIQEASTKIPLLKNANWHLIGHLQRNKAKKAVELFSTIHSVDSLRIATAISKATTKCDKTIDIYCELNMGEEESKNGIAPRDAAATVAQIAELPNLRVIGLMTMAPFIDDEAILRKVFSDLRELRATLVERGDAPPSCTGLSMGMSTDFEYAIEEGATVVRVGSALFE